MLRIALVAAVAVVLLGVIVDEGGATAIDRAAFDVLDPIRDRSVLDVVRVLTDLGSFPVVIVAGIAAAVYAAVTGRPILALTMIGGVAAVHLLVPLLKDVFDRPRPEGRFYEPVGFSFPSGHSAQAVVWVAAAAVLARRALLIAAAVLAAAIGLSRLYLHVHYLTDVLGGFALGALAFAPVLARTRP